MACASADAVSASHWRPSALSVIARKSGSRLSGLGLPVGVVEAFACALASVVSAADAQADRMPRDELQLLDVDETAELLGVSRTTVTRMVNEGVLPSLVVRRGKVQKTRRIPRVLVERIVADAIAGAQVDMEGYASAWLADHMQARGRPETG